MSFIFREKWIWIIIGMCILVLIGPYLLMWVILQMPDVLRASFVFFMTLGWGIVAGYKDWLMDAKKEKRFPFSRVDAEPASLESPSR
jgi:hypothetical protein